MAQELKCRVAIVGGGPAGCMCAYFLQNDCEVTIFEGKSPLATLLATGGGRCNLAHAEYEFRELVKNYPRGEKFLYSVFSKFSTINTVDFFESIGVPTYTQDDLRIFPISNSAVDVRSKFLNALDKTEIVEEKVLEIKEVEKGFRLKSSKASYHFDKVVIAVGGHAGFELAKSFGHNIIEPKPSLTGLKTRENFLELSGVSFKNIQAKVNKNTFSGDFMFTHTGVTGPLIYQISSVMARENFPYCIYLDFVGEIDFQKGLNENSQKSIKNLIADFVPKSFAEFILEHLNIDANTKCHQIDGATRDKILQKLRGFQVTAESSRPDGEVVTSGGVDLKEINSKTMQSKLVDSLYFCGEVLDIDGFCGGFNLQNCWSTGFVAAEGVLQS